MLNEMKSRILSGKKMKKAIVGVILCLLYSTFLLAQVDTDWVRRYNGPGTGINAAEQTSRELQSHRERIDSHTRASNKGTQFQSLSNLEEAWVQQYASGLGTSLESAIAIVVDNSGNVIVTGSGTGDGLSYGSSYDYVTIKYDAAGNELWVARYNGPGNSYDYPKALAVDGSGNVYVTGYSWGSGSSYDYATIKYNASGNELWVDRYDGTGNSYAYDIAVDGSGNVYVTGSSWSSATSYDYTTIKYDATGNQLWKEQYNGPWNADDGATALSVDGSGNVYVTGWSTGSGTAYDYATIKYDASGNQLWVARYNGPGYENDIARAVSVDGSGNVIVTGVSVGLGTWDDYATIKYDALGNELWVARYNGPGNGGDGATAMAVDNSGNIYVTGYCWDSGMMTMDDYATIKYDPSGNQLWVAFYNGSMNGIDRATAIDVDGSGNVYVTGSSMSMMGGDDFTTIKYDNLGNEIWVAVYDGNNMDRANAITIDGSGNVYVTGFSYGVGVDTRDDFATIKYDAAGNQQWFAWYDGPGNSWDKSFAMAVDGSGNVYVTGSSTSGGVSSTDYATIKYDASGNQLWVARYVCPGESWGVPKDIAVDGSGNVYVTGYVWFSDIVYNDYVTIKYDASGNELWVAQYNGPDSKNDYGRVIAVDGSGNVYVTGGSVGIGTTYDYATIKYDASGNELWVARYNGPAGNGADYANAMTIDGSGNVYVTGESRIVPTGNSYDYATIKYDAAGNELWVARYNGPGNHNDRGQHIAVDNSGNVIVTGNSRGSGTLSDYGTIKYDASGNELWVARYNGPGNSYDNVAALAVDGSGNVYVTGGSVGIGTTYDYSTIKYDATGAELWVARYNMGPEATAESAADLAVDNSGDVYVTGSSFSDPYSYLVTIKYDASGNQLSTALYKSPGDASASADAIALNAFNIFITGSFALDMRSIIGTIKYVQAGIIGDFNYDGYVDATDLQMFGDHWLFVDTDPGWDSLYDLAPDGIIDAADLQVFGDHWNEGTPPKSDSGKSGKGPNENAGIVFDLDATTYGNQNLTGIPSQPAGTYIRIDVYCTGVNNLDTYQFEVIYDPTELTYVTATATNPITYEPNILTTNGGTALGWMINTSTPGVLSIAYTLAYTDTLEAPEGEGLIADIVFLSLVDTYGTLSFGDVYYYDSYGVVDLITDTGTATLPFELSAFTATFSETNGYTTIEWTTASENDVIGFNIYRNDCDEFSTAKKINSEIVEGHGSTTEIHEYEFVDIDQLHYGTTYYYWLESVELSGINSVCESISLTPEEGTGGFIDDFEANILTNYPNPFKGSTTIEYGIKGMLRAEIVEIRIYNILGQLVDTVEGKYGTATWNSTTHSTGIYFYQLKTDNYNEVKKMMIQ